MSVQTSPISELPSDSRVWLFPLLTPLSESAKVEVLAKIDDYLVNWKAHGAALSASYLLLHDQILLVAADEGRVKASGCSIDSLMKQVSSILNEQGARVANPADIFYLEGESVRVCDRKSFKTMLESGTVDGSTAVFDFTIASLGEFRSGKLEPQMKESWHAKAFGL